jgi:RNA polymerase sigma-70 factor, ECF subfamily
VETGGKAGGDQDIAKLSGTNAFGLAYPLHMSYAGIVTWNQFGEIAVGTLPEKEPRSRRAKITAIKKPGVETVAATKSGGQWFESQVRGNEQARPRPVTTVVERRLEVDWAIVVRRCLDGVSAAWAELVKAQHRRVYGLCYRFTGSAHDAEDLTQEVFLKVYGNLTSFDVARGSFPTWLTTLTRNLLVDHFRRGRNQRVTDSLDAGWEDTSELQISDRLADPQAGPHQHAAAREIERMVQQALTKISPELREAVILRDLQDLDYKEIAQVLRIPEGTVKSRISRGRAELARLLERNKRQVV